MTLEHGASAWVVLRNDRPVAAEPSEAEANREVMHRSLSDAYDLNGRRVRWAVAEYRAETSATVNIVLNTTGSGSSTQHVLDAFERGRKFEFEKLKTFIENHAETILQAAVEAPEGEHRQDLIDIARVMKRWFSSSAARSAALAPPQVFGGSGAKPPSGESP